MKLKDILEGYGSGWPMTYEQWKKEMAKRGYKWLEKKELEDKEKEWGKKQRVKK